MPTADPVITDLSTWDATTWIAAVAAVIALGALVTAVFARLDSRRSSRAGVDSADAAKRSATASERSAMTGDAAVTASQRSAEAAERSAASGETSAEAAQRSAGAAEDANALLRREAEEREAGRRDSAGPMFTSKDTRVEVNRNVRIRLRIDGGPGDMRIVVRPAGVPWCAGIAGGPMVDYGTSVEFPSLESGDDVVLVASLTTLPWRGHERIVLPLSVTASTQDGEEWWERRVSVPLLPPIEMPRRIR